MSVRFWRLRLWSRVQPIDFQLKLCQYDDLLFDPNDFDSSNCEENDQQLSDFSQDYSIMSQDASDYIVGFVAFKLKRMIYCGTCMYRCKL